MKTLILTKEQVKLLQEMVENQFELMRQFPVPPTRDEAIRLQNIRHQLERQNA